ncbi:nuclear prelamin A recognition factor isoform X2 [Enhydra lutris kenyoni]|uniref:Nuclear prelamin A recognition factor n=1 Tax=Enhydra lutris kenyoni TaxID=391180 RepID=A0A2Y9LCE0_ENHLU|nr:nuclear prelamin A recognition factor isoform X2 [Enhydra lutris kenyoni]
MKCEHCTRKECSKKTKTEDQENASAEVSSLAQENGEKGEFRKLADAKIFLSDCLACDSCVTAEEGVQVSQQNAKDFFRVLNLNKKCDRSQHKVLVVSVCPQSLPYFAAKFRLSVTDASRRLCGFLKSLGVHYVFDTAVAADFSILESQKEFVRRYQQHSKEEPALPMLTSACPGWVRYAERVLGHPVTPHLCTAKSPQQIMGSLVKDYFARRQNLSPDKIFHVIVAPCYDKKLEALREDLPTTSHGSRGADCVLTSGEVVRMMEQSDHAVRDAAVDTLFGGLKEEEEQRFPGGHPRKEWGGSVTLRCCVWLSKHPERGSETEEGQVPISLRGGARLRWGLSERQRPSPDRGRAGRQGAAAADGRHLRGHPCAAPGDQRPRAGAVPGMAGRGRLPQSPGSPAHHVPGRRAPRGQPGHQVVKVEPAAREGGTAERGPETLQENGSASRLLPWFSEFSTLFAGGSLSV